MDRIDNTSKTTRNVSLKSKLKDAIVYNYECNVTVQLYWGYH